MSLQNHTANTILAGLILTVSCQEGIPLDRADSSHSAPPDSTGGPDYEASSGSPDGAKDSEPPSPEGSQLTPEEKELYLKVQEISEKQRETDRKLEEILSHVESFKNPPQSVSLDDAKKKELKEGWVEIEEQKKSAIQELGRGTALANRGSE